MNIYQGIRTPAGCQVTVNQSHLSPRHGLRNHSPDGFEWGYPGSGPAQLALAILAHEYDSDIALRHYQDFKLKVIATLQGDVWTLTSQDIHLVMNTLKP